MRSNSMNGAASSKAPASCTGQCRSWRRSLSPLSLSYSASLARQCQCSRSSRSQRRSQHPSLPGCQRRSRSHKQQSNHHRCQYLSAASRRPERLHLQSLGLPP
jgi:hypothetical protein